MRLIAHPKIDTFQNYNHITLNGLSLPFNQNQLPIRCSVVFSKSNFVLADRYWSILPPVTLNWSSWLLRYLNLQIPPLSACGTRTHTFQSTCAQAFFYYVFTPFSPIKDDDKRMPKGLIGSKMKSWVSSNASCSDVRFVIEWPTHLDIHLLDPVFLKTECSALSLTGRGCCCD